jgi:hypothetical protein
VDLWFFAHGYTRVKRRCFSFCVRSLVMMIQANFVFRKYKKCGGFTPELKSLA